MKRALQFKIITAFFMLPMLMSATAEIKDKHEKTKTINKTYTVNSNATLKINNSYGNLDIITWDEDKIVFEITIKASGNSEEKIEKRLNEIDVKFEASKDLVYAKTLFNKDNSNSWWNWGSKSNVNLKINYVVKMPIGGKIDLNNDYGNINVDKLEGKAEINCDYGKITTKELMDKNNIINFDYTNNSYFEYINGGKINADYSGFTIAKTKAIYINADYTNSKIEIAEDVNYNCDYGSMKIDKANTISGNGDYLTTVIGDVYKNVSLKADYGSIKINRMTENAGNVNIESDYVGIKIGYAPNYNFNFTLNLDYASLRDGDGLIITKEIKDSSSKFYQGYYGNASSGNNISIKSDYGSVTFFKN